MTPASFFNIVLKIFGLFFLKDVISWIPQLLSTAFFSINADRTNEGIISMIILGIVIALWCVIIHYLLYKTNFLVEKLKLGDGFEEDSFTFNTALPGILKITLIVVAGVILVEEIPDLCHNLYNFWQQTRLRYDSSTNFSPVLVSLAKIVIAFLIIGERKRIIDLVMERKTKNDDNTETVTD